jgi:hypothetical protein
MAQGCHLIYSAADRGHFDFRDRPARDEGAVRGRVLAGLGLAAQTGQGTAISTDGQGNIRIDADKAKANGVLGFSILSDHAHAARLCGFAVAALEAAAEASAAPGPWIELPQAGKASLYCVACRTTLASEWRLAADPDGKLATIDAGQQLVIVGLPFADRLAGAAAQGALERLRYDLESQYPHAQWLGLVPNRAVLPATRSQGITLVEAETELPQLDADLLVRLQRSRSIRT